MSDYFLLHFVCHSLTFSVTKFVPWGGCYHDSDGICVSQNFFVYVASA